MSTPNVERLEAVLAQIKDHPETWNQRFWGQKTECGTAYCFAGHAIQMYAQNEYHWELVKDAWARPGELQLVGMSGMTVGVCRVASKILGINQAEGDAMFWAANSLEQLEAMVKGLANGEDITSEDWREQNYFGLRNHFFL